MGGREREVGGETGRGKREGEGGRGRERGGWTEGGATRWK